MVTGTFVHISGQVPARSDGSVIDTTAFAEQTEQVFSNVAADLGAVGASWEHVVKMTYCVTDLGDVPVVRCVRDRHLEPSSLSASSLVQVAGLVHPDFRIEIDAVAAIEPAGSTKPRAGSPQ